MRRTGISHVHHYLQKHKTFRCKKRHLISCAPHTWAILSNHTVSDDDFFHATWFCTFVNRGAPNSSLIPTFFFACFFFTLTVQIYLLPYMQRDYKVPQVITISLFQFIAPCNPPVAYPAAIMSIWPFVTVAIAVIVVVVNCLCVYILHRRANSSIEVNRSKMNAAGECFTSVKARDKLRQDQKIMLKAD